MPGPRLGTPPSRTPLADLPPMLRHGANVLIIAIVVGSCGETALEPDVAPSASLEENNERGRLARWLGGGAPGPRLREERWIGPEGGRLELAGIAIDIPAGAIRSAHRFSIALRPTGDLSDRVVADFEPHGLTF